MSSRFLDGYVHAKDEIIKTVNEIEQEDGDDKDYKWRWLRLRTLLGANRRPIKNTLSTKNRRLAKKRRV